MKRSLTLFFSILCLTSLAQSKTSDYTLTIKFDPSFLYSSKLIIHSAQDSSYAQLELYKHYKDVNPISTSKAKLEAKQLTQLTDFLKTYKFRDNTSFDSVVTYKKTANGDSIREAKEIMGADGIIVRGVLDQNKTITKFEFWSPDKGTVNDKLSKILINILYSAYNDEKSVIYFEQLEQYFAHGLGLKKMSDDPLKYKLYGEVSFREDSALAKFFESLPRKKKVFIDLSNIESIDFDKIEDYSSRNKDLYWVNPNDWALIHLYKVGIPNSRILSKKKIVRIEVKNGKRNIIYKNY